MTESAEFIPCVPPPEHPLDAVGRAAIAVDLNPANAPPVQALAQFVASIVGSTPVDPTPQFIAVATSKYWGAKGRKFGVSFLDNPNAATRRLILSHMNAWSESCNVSFEESGDGEVRISQGRGGYWSYLGTDILGIPSGQATMNLQGFTEKTPESEYRRVVRHETGHTLGCPHEHMRPAIVARIDRVKAIAYFARNQGWGPGAVIQQVLTPLDESSLMGTPSAEDDSIMCYQLPASITKDGQPIVGGTDITASDAAFMGKIYPRELKPIEPARPPTGPSNPPPVRPSVGKMTVDIGAAIEMLVANGFSVT